MPEVHAACAPAGSSAALALRRATSALSDSRSSALRIAASSAISPMPSGSATAMFCSLIITYCSEKPDFAPGEGWKYNNSGYVLVGAVIEAASGMPWHAYLKKAFFEPLGMKNTGYGDETVAVIPGHVTGYTLADGRWAVARYLSMTQPHAAGALVSTVDDLLRWNRALHEGKLLGAGSYRQMITPIGKAKDEKYGFGITHDQLRGQDMLQHGGGIFGFSTYLLYLPDEDVTAAVLYNADSGRPPAIGTDTLARMLAARAIGKPYPQKQAIKVDAAALGEYEGVYRIDKDAARALRVVDGKLTSQRTGSPSYMLVPIGKDDFLFEEGLSRMRFERDADRQASRRCVSSPTTKARARWWHGPAKPCQPNAPSVDLPRSALERLAGSLCAPGHGHDRGPRGRQAHRPAHRAAGLRDLRRIADEVLSESRGGVAGIRRRQRTCRSGDAAPGRPGDRVQASIARSVGAASRRELLLCTRCRRRARGGTPLPASFVRPPAPAGSRAGCSTWPAAPPRAPWPCAGALP